jgi:hypothetical protein
MRIREIAAVIAIAAVATACVENPDPRSPSLEKMQTEGIGGWIVATARSGWSVQGELISATPEYIHILRVGQPGAALVYMRTSDVVGASVYTYEAEGGLGVFGFLGTLSTISHGFFLVLSAPVWMIATAIAVSYESKHILLEYPDASLQDIAMWARFPQGIPPTVDEEAILVPRANRHPRAPIITPPPTTTTPPPITAPGATPPVAPATNPAEMFQQAKGAAARNDCALVLQLSGAVQLADQTFWDRVFSQDPEIRRCLNL